MDYEEFTDKRYGTIRGYATKQLSRAEEVLDAFRERIEERE